MAFHCPALLLALGAFVYPSGAAAADIIGVHLEDGSGRAKRAEADGGVVDLYDPVLRLNRFSFHKTILEEYGEEVSHWIVLFCPGWYEPCQALDPIYRQLTEKLQDQLNSALLTREVRFAAVDCATEKALCNTQNVGMNYPFVAHYQHRKQVAVWRGKSLKTDGTRLMSVLQKWLGAVDSTSTLQPETEDVTPDGAQHIPTDFLVIVTAIIGNAWIMSRGSFSGEAPPRARSNPTRCQKKRSGAEDLPSETQVTSMQQASSMACSLPNAWGLECCSYQL